MRMAEECKELRKELELKAEDYIMEKLNLHVRGFDEIHCNVGVLMKLVADYAFDVTKELQTQIEDLKKQIKDIRHQEVVDMYSRYPC